MNSNNNKYDKFDMPTRTLWVYWLNKWVFKCFLEDWDGWYVGNSWLKVIPDVGCCSTKDMITDSL